MFFDHQAECPFCHAQMLIQSIKSDMTAEELAKEASGFCTCDGARLYRGMKIAENKLDITLGEGCLDRGFNYIAPEGTIEAVRSICKMIILDKITGGG